MPIALMADGSSYTVGKLLGKGDSNAKLKKSDDSGKGFLTVGLSLAPANESGYNTCPHASAGCKAACLFTAGMGAFQNVKSGRIAKTRLFFQQRPVFYAMLRGELTAHRKRAQKQGKQLACRLNVLSDIPWEKMFPELFTEFQDVQFYDYTKNAKRATAFSLSRELLDYSFFPNNYHLTFSRSESNIKEFTYIVSTTIANAAVVFASKQLPSHYAGRVVVSGDETDLRFLDESKVIVGLYAKGKARKDASGFVVK